MPLLGPFVGVVLVLASVWAGRALVLAPAREALKVATGSTGGSSHAAMQALGPVLQEAAQGFRVELVPTGGGAENAQLLIEHRVDVALVHNHVNPPQKEAEEVVRSIAPLFDEALQIVVQDPALLTLTDLSGKRLGIGPPGSGTEALVPKVLAAAGMPPDSYQAHRLAHADAAEAFLRGDLDAVFVLAGVRAPSVERMLAGAAQSRLLALDDWTDGVLLAQPALVASVIPARAYGSKPPQKVVGVGSTALLVVRADLPETAAWELTRHLAERRLLLAEESQVLGRAPSLEVSRLRFPLHPGADRYHHRNDPPFILAWADTFSLAITVLLLSWSSVAGIRTWVRTARKERVDKYYGRLQVLSARINEADTVEGLASVRVEMQGLWREAIDDLMSERVLADDAFSIFQDAVRWEIGEIDRKLRVARSVPVLV